ADGDAAGVGVLDDRDGRAVVVVGGAPGGVGVDVVVVAHGLAVQLDGLGETARSPLGDVDRGTLVRVLAVAEHVGAGPRGPAPGREAGRDAEAVGALGEDDVGGRHDLAHPR